MAELEGIPKTGAAIVVCSQPDYCRSPKKIVPYQIVALFSEAVDVSPNVRFTGLPATTMSSRIPTVHGDEEGTAGITSGVVKGWCKPVSNPAATVRVNGHKVVRHTTEFVMNGRNPTNTAGPAQYQRAAPAPAAKGFLQSAIDGVLDQAKEDLRLSKEFLGNLKDVLVGENPGTNLQGVFGGVARGLATDPILALDDLLSDLLTGAISPSDLLAGLSLDTIKQFGLEFFDINNIAADLATGTGGGIGSAIGRGATLPFDLLSKIPQVFGKGAKAARAGAGTKLPRAGREVDKANKLVDRKFKHLTQTDLLNLEKFQKAQEKLKEAIEELKQAQKRLEDLKKAAKPLDEFGRDIATDGLEATSKAEQDVKQAADKVKQAQKEMKDAANALGGGGADKPGGHTVTR